MTKRRVLSMTDAAVRARAWRRTSAGKAKVKAYNIAPDEAVARRDRARVQSCRRYGWALPPKEADCPPRPRDGRCDCCCTFIGMNELWLDHDHNTGAFRGWICPVCNHGGGSVADVDRLQNRVEFLQGKLPWQ